MSDASGVWAFYYIQGEDGEDRSHPNAFRIPAPAGGADVTLADVLRHFPLQAQKSAFHFRFRINSAVKGGGSSFFWLDVTAPAQKVPLVNGRVICKLLRLERPARRGLVFRRKPVLKWAPDARAPVQPLAPFHRAASSPAFEQDRPPKYADAPPGSGGSSRTGSGSAEAAPIASAPAASSPPESFEDFLSGGGSASTTNTKPTGDVDLMADGGAWRPAPAASDLLSAMDPLAAAKSKPKAPPRAAPSAPPKFDDDTRQTVGPVTLAEMEAHATSTADGSNVYNAALVDKSTKSADVRRAMEQRERQVAADVARAREELRAREEAARAVAAGKDAAAHVLGPRLKAWAEDNGRVKNIRTLLSTMHHVMWDGAKWTEVGMGKLIQPADVKKHYRKAMIVVHPDKSSGRNAEQLLIAERVFAAVNTAWDEFAKTNPC